MTGAVDFGPPGAQPPVEPEPPAPTPAPDAKFDAAPKLSEVAQPRAAPASEGVCNYGLGIPRGSSTKMLIRLSLETGTAG